MNNDFSNLFLRNKIFIKEEVQELLKKTKVSLLGCGVASQIAILAARTGVLNFFIADGDKVELSNLNRQSFYLSSLNINKAVEIKKYISQINKFANVEILSRNITEDDITNIVQSSGFVISTVDVGPIYYSIVDKIKLNKKVGIFPMNVGFGSLIFVMTEDSGNFDDIFGSSLPMNDFDFYKHLFPIIKNRLPQYLTDLGEKFFKKNNSKKPFPQIGIANYLTASMVMTIIINVLEGKNVPKIPEPIFLDIKNLLNK